jgi:predicted nucleotidyltransferase
MRLDEKTRMAIKNAVLSLDSNAKVFLFGSRTDDSKKGGDIDILVLSDKLKFSDKIQILTNIFKQIEEQKIDIIIAKSLDDSPFVKFISNQVIPL